MLIRKTVKVNYTFSITYDIKHENKFQKPILFFKIQLLYELNIGVYIKSYNDMENSTT